MSSGIAKLVNSTISYDSIGQAVETETLTTIYVEELSITRAEWANAGRNGFNPETLLATPFMNYGGQRLVEYNGSRYGIYRTYQKGDNIELYLEKKGGAGVVSTTTSASTNG